MTPWLLLLAAYLVGAFPSSYLVGKTHGVDLRRHGSGNLGGTNAYRVLGAWAALLVIVLDALKGFFPVWFFPLWDGVGSPVWALAYGMAAIGGHIWSAFTGFRGGKGVATAAGALFALAPLATLIGVLVWVGLVLVTRIASVASMSAAVIVPLVAYISKAAPGTVAFAAVLATLVWWTHRGNILRLIQREELRLGAPAKRRDREGEG